MSHLKAATITAKATPSKSSEIHDATELLDSRVSKELVIAFCGPIGCESGEIIDEFREQFTEGGYIVKPIKVSELILEAIESLEKSKLEIDKDLFEGESSKPFEEIRESKYERVKYLQNAGNLLRQENDRSILSQFVARKIMLLRAKHAEPEYNELVDSGEINSSEVELSKFSVERFVPDKTVYLVDQLKNPAEVDLLRSIYGDLFYLIGVVRTKNARKVFLENKYDLTEAQAADLDDRDRKQEKRHQQQLEKTLFRSDYFISSQTDSSISYSSQVSRFVKLIHKIGMSSPTLDEHSMYIAHSSGLKSACLSRQVGAAIVNDVGDVIATGRNDVPLRGGGLYPIIEKGEVDEVNDMRCYNYHKECFNDKYKTKYIRDEIDDLLNTFLKGLGDDAINQILSNISDNSTHSESDIAALLADNIFKNTRTSSIIEFSRAVHAEMDAITTVARSGDGSTKDTTLFCTTFPCHNCASHIISSGIKRVVYIEPYEKSEALRLFKTEIVLDKQDGDKVVFEHFKGAAPSRYQDFFQDVDGRKKEDGTFNDNKDFVLKKSIHPFLDSYRTLEVKIAEQIKKPQDPELTI